MQLIIAINLFMSFIELRYKTLQYFEDVCELKSYLLVFQIMLAGEKVFGRRLFKFLSRPVVYDQFVGGENPRELATTVTLLNKSNLR